MSLDAGSVHVTLGGNFNQAGFLKFGAAVDGAAAKMRTAEREIGASSKRSTAALSTVAKGAGGGLVAAFAAATFATYKSVQAAVEFEKSMRNVNSIAKLSEPALKSLSKGVLSLAGETAQAPKTLAEGLYQLVSSGFNARDSLVILKSSAKAATAGLTDTETATTAVAGALNAYHLKAKDAALVSDELFQTVNRGVITFPELASTIGTVLPFAAKLGIGLNQVGASISTLTKQGIPAAEATTFLKDAIVTFLQPNKQMQEAIKKTGAASGEALIKSKGFQGALEAVAGTTDGTSGALKALFPDIRGAAAAFALTGKNAKGAEADVRGFSRAAVAGVTDKVFAEQAKSTDFQIRQLKTNLTTLGVEIGTALLPVVNDVASAMARFVGEMNSGKGAGGSFVSTLRSGFDDLLGVVTTFGHVLLLAAQASNAIGLSNFDTGALERGIKNIDHYRESLRRPFGAKVSVDTQAAIETLNQIKGTNIKPKVARILLSGDTTAKQKIAQLEALGFSPKAARVLVTGVPKSLADIAAVKDALGSVNDKTVNVHIATLFTQSGNPSPGTSSVGSKPPVKLGKPKAAGRSAGGAETALVGEGHGPELITDGVNSYVVSSPTIVALSPEDAVIPFGDPAQSGRALGLLLGMLGIDGYAKGKPPKKAAAKKGAPKALPVPDAVTFGAVPEDDLANSRDHARDDYQKRRDTIHDLDSKIRDQRKKVSGAKAGKARNAARAKLNDLEADRRRYNNGEGKLQSLAQMRKAWQDLEAQVKVLHQTNQEIERLNTRQETDRTLMATASKTGDLAGWKAARGDRAGLLATLRDKYAKAVKLAKPGSNFQADLEGTLAGLDSDIADAADDTFAGSFDGGMTAAEKAQLDALNAGVSLAALTAGLGDDTAAATAKQGFLENLLSAAQADPARGGNSVIADLADQVKQARDNVASLTGGGGAGSATNESQDLQAQIDQANTARDVAVRQSQIDSRALATFQGAGDIGSAGWRPNITINTLHPGDPATLAAIGNAAVGGIGLQGFVPSTRTNLGL